MKPAGAEKNSPQRVEIAAQRIGLCARCVHATPTAGPRNVFVRCGLSKTDAGYPRYPVLPVTSCLGFVPRAAEN